MDINLTIGKFNPLHNGHNKVFKEMERYSSESIQNVIAIIGTNEITRDRPFPVTSRAHLMETHLSNSNVDFLLITSSNAFSLMEYLHFNGYNIKSLFLGGDRMDEYKGVFRRATKEEPVWNEIIVQRPPASVSSSMIRHMVYSGFLEHEIREHISDIDTNVQDFIISEMRRIDARI